MYIWCAYVSLNTDNGYDNDYVQHVILLLYSSTLLLLSWCCLWIYLDWRDRTVSINNCFYNFAEAPKIIIVVNQLLDHLKKKDYLIRKKAITSKEIQNCLLKVCSDCLWVREMKTALSMHLILNDDYTIPSKFTT